MYSEGGNEMDPFIDVFTDHYVVPRGCYGPMIARARGKKSMETETWFVGTEYQLPQGAAQFLASGQNSVSPWHPRVLFETVPGGNDEAIIPSPGGGRHRGVQLLCHGPAIREDGFQGPSSVGVSIWEGR